ncbi:hypothetical protein EW146_g3065 [Bondarzewia mesenterica]|uniref:Cyclin-D1-binding protein 1-like N-terminal domain-containing protein n=1 Tax=Bondarzewia mesenterica TaxID=1095465 RepID=A0A4V3XFJ9_9AGAM|nr:hypothetical protein EW146_g3065 [Bondarzewia mesenterica]
MSDIQKVAVSLVLVSEQCSAANAALANSFPPHPSQPLASLRRDLISLLSLVYSHTTKLSIALNPATPTYKAALSPLKDLATHTSTLASNAASFDPIVHGRSLTDEVHHLVKSVFDAIQKLAQAHLSLMKEGAAKGKIGAAGEEYLVKTAAVHDLIDRARSEGPSGLSKDNVHAVRKLWKSRGEPIADAIAELDDVIESADGDEDDEESDASDGLSDADLDFGSYKTSPEQRKLAEMLKALIQNTYTLHKQVGAIFLASPPLPTLPSPPSNTALDALLDSASELAIASDELVSRIYSDADDTTYLQEARDEFGDALNTMGRVVDSFWTEPPEQKDEEVEPKKGSRRWFEGRFATLYAETKVIEWPKMDRANGT